MSTTSLQPGSVFAGDYRIIGILGSGGMGTVYIAHQLSTGNRRALKLMHVWLPGSDPGARDRFVVEATVGSRIQSDHVVQVVNAGIEGDIPWLAMELLDGDTLSDQVRLRGVLSVPEIELLFKQLNHALSAAHRAQVVHRDLKPDNIFIATPRTPDAHFFVKVLDLGISKVLSTASGRAPTQIGTPGWQAPEQGKRDCPVGPFTDVWAFGLLAFWAVTGRAYWLADSGAIRDLIDESDGGARVRPTERARAFGCTRYIPPEFDEWFAACVAVDPRQRFQEAGSAYAHLAPILERVREQTRKPASLEPMVVSWHQTPVPPSVAQPAVSMQTPISAPFSRPQVVTPPPVLSSPWTARSLPRRALLGSGVAAVAAVGALWLGVLHSAWWAEHVCSADWRTATTATAADLAQSCAKACTSSSGPSCFRGGDLVSRFHVGDAPLAAAKEEYEQGCAANDAASCRRLGELQAGHPEQALEAYTKSCDKGDLTACAEQGALLEFAVPAKKTEALALYNKACSVKTPLGCAYLAFGLITGRTGTRDVAAGKDKLRSATAGLQAACADGEAASCVAEAVSHDFLGEKPAAGGAESPYRASCDAGFAAGCVNLATAQVLGLNGVAPKPSEGLTSLQHACADGDREACGNAGAILAGADVVVRNGAQGVTQLRIACTETLHVGCAGWGAHAAVPPEIKADRVEAQRLTDKACAAGVVVSCINSGGFRCAGLGGRARECDKAREQFDQACKSGDSAGCAALGTLYLSGEGVSSDKSRAEELLKSACDAGELDACTKFGDSKTRADDYRNLCEAQHVALACRRIGLDLTAPTASAADRSAGVAYLTRAAMGDGLDHAELAAFVDLGKLETDKDKADAFYQKACDAKYWPGCAKHGVYLAIQKKDLATALRVWRDGCDQQDNESCLDQAEYSWNGQGGPLSKPAAAETFDQLCTAGLAHACTLAATAWTVGFTGTPANATKVKGFYDRACSLGECKNSQPATPPECALMRQFAGGCYKQGTSGVDCEALADGVRARNEDLGTACQMACVLGARGTPMPTIPCQ